MMPLPSFDPDFASNREWADLYRECGLQVVPCRPREKQPALKEWRNLTDGLIGDDAFRFMFDSIPPTYGLGILTGSCSGNVFVIDLDLHKPVTGPLARAWWAMVTNGAEIRTPTQRTGGGGLQILLRAPDDVRMPTNKTSIGVDFRGQGGFAVLAPTLHASGRTYEWLPGLAPWEVEIAEASHEILEAVFDCAAEHGGTPGGTRTATDSPVTDLSAFGKIQDGRESYMAAMVFAALVSLRAECPIAPAGQEMEAHAREAFGVYERNVVSRLDADGRSNAERLEEEGRGWSAFWFKWRRTARKWDGVIAEEAAKRAPPPEPPKGDAPPPEGIHATPFEWVDPSSIPPRAWVYGKHYIRKFVSTTVAPGGVGKTVLTIAEALAIVTGLPLLGVAPDERTNVWVWNGEDPLEELQRRVMATAVHYGLSPADVTGRLFVDTGRAMPIVIASKTRDGAVINAPVVEQVVATIKANKIGVMVIDPFVACHRVTENDNTEIERVAKTWAQIADETGCAIELVHHVRKTNGNEVGVEDGRGAGALLAAARSARALNRMTGDEAARVGIKEPGLYFRTDNGKSNLAPPSSGAKWFKLEAVDLQNDTPMTADTPARPSDWVGVVTAWEWPDMTADVTASDMHEARRIVGTGKYRADSQASDWVGYAILEALGVSAEDATEADKAKAKSLQKMWVGTGALEEYQAPDERRKLRKYVRAGAFKDA